MRQAVVSGFVLVACAVGVRAGFGDTYIGEVAGNWSTSSKVTVTASPTAWGDDLSFGPQFTVNGGAFTVVGGEKLTDGVSHTYSPVQNSWIANNGGGAYTSPAGVSCSAWIQFSFDRAYAIKDMDIWNGGMDGPGNNRSFKETAISYSLTGLPGSWRTLNYTRPGLPTGELTKGGSPGTGTWFSPSDAAVPFYARAKYVVFSGMSNYGMSDAYMMSEVRFYVYDGDADKATFPMPTDAAIRISTNLVLSWIAGFSANSHDIYFGTSFDLVRNAGKLKGDLNGDGKVDFRDFAMFAGQWQLNPTGLTADLNDDGIVDLYDFDQTIATNWLQSGNGIYKGHSTSAAQSFSPGPLTPGRTYYWRIDANGTTNVWKGDVWSFTVRGIMPAASNYYVATNGTDDNDGLTASTPFRTIQKARDTIANSSGLPPGGVTVNIRGGKYFLSSEVDFTGENSGTATSPIVYRAYNGERPRFIGGVPLDPAWFTVVPSGAPVFSRMPSSSFPNVYQCNLLAQGITNFGRFRSRGVGFAELFHKGLVAHMELSCDGAMMQLARWPNNGYARISSVVDSNTFTYANSALTGAHESRWPLATTPWAHGFWAYDFYDQYLPIQNPGGFEIAANGVNLGEVPGAGLGNGYSDNQRRWRLVNLLEELDQAQEFYIETKEGNPYYGMLYFWPPGSSVAGKEMMVSTVGENSTSLVKLTGASNIVFRGLSFEISRFNAVEMQECQSVVLDNCTIRNVGNIGVRIEGGNSCGVQNSEISGLDLGIGLSGGNRFTLAKGDHFARNNLIHDFGRWARCYQPGVALYGVGNEVSNNEIYNGPHSGILLYHNNHLVQLNKIRNVVQQSSDAGAIYSYWGWDTRGSLIKWNCIYDLTDTVPMGTGVWAIYLDGYTSGTTVEGNIIDNISAGVSGSAYAGGIFLNGGRDNDVNNCIITYTPNAISAAEPCVYPVNSAASQRTRVSSFNYQNPPWSTAYPALAAIPATGDISNYAHPGGCKIRNNLEKWNTTWTKVALINGQGDPFNTAYCIMTNNLIDNDPRYIDRTNKFFAPTAYGSERIPFERIGVLHQALASNPIPRNNSTSISRFSTVLYWGPALGSTTQNVYFGTTPGALPLVSPGQTYSSYVPATLNPNTTYYWRVDGVDGSGSVTTGTEWRFTTGP